LPSGYPLPPAPRFVGREAELEQLRGFWRRGFRGVLALVGLGVAGKTALAARFLEELASAPAAARPGRIFLWSFYNPTPACSCSARMSSSRAAVGNLPREGDLAPDARSAPPHRRPGGGDDGEVLGWFALSFADAKRRRIGYNPFWRT